MRTVVDLAHLRPLDHKTAMQIAANENELFARLLRTLDGDDWDAPTDCELWAVRDIVAHLTAWGEALTSPREGLHQFVASRRLVRELGGSTNAQNQIQVEDRKHLGPEDLIARFDRVSGKFLRVRRVVGVVGKAIPHYNPLLGGFSTLGFIADSIFTRDTFMHRIDITRATRTEMVMGLHQDVLVTDIVRDWARRAGVPVRVELEGPGGGLFEARDASVVVRTSAIDFCRFNAGRLSPEDLEVDGDPADVNKALSARAPF